MKEEVYNQVVEYCESSPTKEVCGVIINKRGRGVFYPCKNLSNNSEYEFIMDPIDRIIASKDGDIVFIVHSHIDVSEDPSAHDIASCNAGKVPWIIYSLLTKKYTTIQPINQETPLIGRQYYYGVQDCWSLIVDVYKRELDKILVYPADPDPEWHMHGRNHFNDLIDAMGFVVVTDNSLIKYDVILMQTGKSPYLNHSALYYGDNIILHHAVDRLSCKEVYGGYWSKVTGKVIRHKDLI